MKGLVRISLVNILAKKNTIMFELQKSSRKLHSHFLPMFAFLLIAGITFSLFGTAPASAAIHRAIGKIDGNDYPNTLTAESGNDAQDRAYYSFNIDTGVTGTLYAVWSDNKELSQHIAKNGLSEVGYIALGQSPILLMSDIKIGTTYYQVLDSQKNFISNKVGITKKADGTTSIKCDIDGRDHYGLCDQKANFTILTANVTENKAFLKAYGPSDQALKTGQVVLVASTNTTLVPKHVADINPGETVNISDSVADGTSYFQIWDSTYAKPTTNIVGFYKGGNAISIACGIGNDNNYYECPNDVSQASNASGGDQSVAFNCIDADIDCGQSLTDEAV